MPIPCQQPFTAISPFQPPPKPEHLEPFFQLPLTFTFRPDAEKFQYKYLGFSLFPIPSKRARDCVWKTGTSFNWREIHKSRLAAVSCVDLSPKFERGCLVTDNGSLMCWKWLRSRRNRGDLGFRFAMNTFDTCESRLLQHNILSAFRCRGGGRKRRVKSLNVGTYLQIVLNLFLHIHLTSYRRNIDIYQLNVGIFNLSGITLYIFIFS